jgi:polysaccharide pyruvyl transferase WcaK-like protein
MSLKIALCGFYAKNNFGDDLMAHHLTKVLSINNSHTVNLFSDKSADGVENGFLSGGHLNSDIIAIGGGGIVNPDFWVFKGDGMNQLKASNKPVVFINVNVTPDFTTKTGFIEDLKNLKAKWWVRTQQSVDILADAGIPSSLLPDVSFRDGVVNHFKKKIGRKNMSVFLNSYVFNKLIHNDNVNEFLQALHNLRIISHYCDWMAKFGWNITFYAAHTDKFVDDRIPSSLAFGSMLKKEHAQWIAEPQTWDELLEDISRSDLVLSMRFHSTTTAIASGVPCVDITHHAKNKSLLEEIGIEDSSTNYSSLSFNDLIKVTQFVENSSVYTSKTDAYRFEAIKRWELFDREWQTFVSKLEDKNAQT